MAAPVTDPTRTVPVRPAPKAVTSSTVSASPRNSPPAWRIRTRAMSVGTIPLGVRANSGWPTIASTSASIREAAGWVIDRRWAATDSCPCSSIA